MGREVSEMGPSGAGGTALGRAPPRLRWRPVRPGPGAQGTIADVSGSGPSYSHIGAFVRAEPTPRTSPRGR